MNAVFVYDDKVVFTFNYKDGSKTATVDEINAELGSDLDGTTPPVSTEFEHHKDGIYFRQRCRGLCGIQVKKESNGFSVALFLFH